MDVILQGKKKYIDFPRFTNMWIWIQINIKPNRCKYVLIYADAWSKWCYVPDKSIFVISFYRKETKQHCLTHCLIINICIYVYNKILFWYLIIRITAKLINEYVTIRFRPEINLFYSINMYIFVSFHQIVVEKSQEQFLDVHNAKISVFGICFD